jgi:hypothetical protein
MNPHVSRSALVRLPAEAYEKHRGKWIALSEDGSSIIASADDLDALEGRLTVIGVDPEKAIFDHVEDDDGYLGAVELL